MFRSPRPGWVVAWRVRRAGVSAPGGLGTLGLLPPEELRGAIGQVREAAQDRSVAVNLLMPFVRRSHVEVCVESRSDGSPSTACSYSSWPAPMSRHAGRSSAAPTG